jgi:hypothetical protein
MVLDVSWKKKILQLNVTSLVLACVNYYLYIGFYSTFTLLLAAPAAAAEAVAAAPAAVVVVVVVVVVIVVVVVVVVVGRGVTNVTRQCQQTPAVLSF